MRTERQGSSKLDTKRVALLIGLVALFLQTAVHLQGQQFRSLGKRDPFLNLTRVMQKEEPTLVTPPLAQRPPGLPGLLVSEVIVTGMAVGEVSKVVLLRGVDNFTYLAHETASFSTATSRRLHETRWFSFGKYSMREARSRFRRSSNDCTRKRIRRQNDYNSKIALSQNSAGSPLCPMFYSARHCLCISRMGGIHHQGSCRATHGNNSASRFIRG